MTANRAKLIFDRNQLIELRPIIEIMASRFLRQKLRELCDIVSSLRQ